MAFRQRWISKRLVGGLVFAVLLGSATVIHAYYSLAFVTESTKVTCWGYAEHEGEFVSIQLRIYGPDGSLLAYDNVANEDYVSTRISANHVGSGTYRCWGYFHQATEVDEDEQFVYVP